MSDYEKYQKLSPLERVLRMNAWKQDIYSGLNKLLPPKERYPRTAPEERWDTRRLRQIASELEQEMGEDHFRNVQVFVDALIISGVLPAHERTDDMLAALYRQQGTSQYWSKIRSAHRQTFLKEFPTGHEDTDIFMAHHKGRTAVSVPLLTHAAYMTGLEPGMDVLLITDWQGTGFEEVALAYAVSPDKQEWKAARKTLDKEFAIPEEATDGERKQLLERQRTAVERKRAELFGTVYVPNADAGRISTVLQYRPFLLAPERTEKVLPYSPLNPIDHPTPNIAYDDPTLPDAAIVFTPSDLIMEKESLRAPFMDLLASGGRLYVSDGQRPGKVYRND